MWFPFASIILYNSVFPNPVDCVSIERWVKVLWIHLTATEAQRQTMKIRTEIVHSGLFTSHWRLSIVVRSHQWRFISALLHVEHVKISRKRSVLYLQIIIYIRSSCITMHWDYKLLTSLNFTTARTKAFASVKVIWGHKHFSAYQINRAGVWTTRTKAH